MNVPSSDKSPERPPNLDVGFSPPGKLPVSLSPPANLSADIGEAEAVKRALKMVDVKFGESSPRVISNQAMTCKEALKIGPEPQLVLEEDPRSNMLVHVVEMKGAFKVRSVSQGVKSPAPFPKALIIVGAADGLILRSALLLE